MKYLHYLLCAALIVTTHAGCSHEAASNENLLETYAQYVVLRMTPGDSTASQHRLDSLLKTRGFTNESFFRELRTVGADPERMRSFYDSVKVRVSRIDSASAR